MSLRRRRIQLLFAVSFAFTVLGLLAISLVALRAIAVDHRAALDITRSDLAALQDVNELQGLLYQKGFAAEYFLTGDERWLKELDRTTPSFERWLESISWEARSPESAQAATALAAEYGRYDADRGRSIERFRAGDRAGAIGMLVAYTDRVARLRDLSNAFIRIRRDDVQAHAGEMDRAWRQALALLVAAVVFAIFGAALSGYLLARRVARPLYELVLRAESAAGGARVEVTHDDEIDALSDQVTRLARRIEASSLELSDQRTRLHQAEKMSALGEMAAAVAHEVMNPLTGVKTAVQLLARTHADADVAETVRAVDAEIGRVEGLARRLVSFARPYQPIVESFAIESAFAQVVQATAGEAGTRNVRVVTQTNGVRSLEADRELVIQALVNLVANACQASPSGATVRLSARIEAAWLLIEVRDEGSGIAPEIARRLFTPFLTTRHDGHGLGLAISQNIVLAHGGRIEPRSNEPEKGTTFVISLPKRSNA